MAVVTEVQVADHMFVSTKTARGIAPAGAKKDIVNAETTQHVSMFGANSVALDVIVHAANPAPPTPEGLEVILEQSNDRSNWFLLAATTTPAAGYPFTGPSAGSALFEWKNSIGMSWVRITFLIDGPTDQVTATSTYFTSNFTVSCTLTTSLL